ncbi:Jasmonate-induced oxygenase 4 [Linum perenne]
MEVEGSPVIRVQSISQAGKSEVPPQYIQPPVNRPDITPKSHGGDDIPVIDLGGDSVREAVAQACKDWGAFQVTNHGVSVQLLDDMRKVGVSFFNDCPMKDRLMYACSPDSAASEGYGSKMLVDSDENHGVLDWRDYFDHHTLPLSRRNPSNWPHYPPNYRDVVSQYSDEMNVLTKKLLGIISESLGVQSSCIEDVVGEFYQNITVSYYPPCPRPELTLGLQSHSDFGALTLLIQDQVSGLEVLKDSHWFPVQPLPEAIVVLVSDQTEVIITNGNYRSAVHRAVTNPNTARLSVATFHDPAKTRNISPAAEIVSQQSARQRYREVNYGVYMSKWYTKGPEGKRNIDTLLIDS